MWFPTASFRSGEEVVIKVRPGGMKHHVLSTREVLNVPDVHADKRSNYDIVDRYTGSTTTSLLVAPVMHQNGKDAIGVIEMINKRAETEEGANSDSASPAATKPFSRDDEKLLKLLCSHASAFISHVGPEAGTAYNPDLALSTEVK